MGIQRATQDESCPLAAAGGPVRAAGSPARRWPGRRGSQRSGRPDANRRLPVRAYRSARLGEEEEAFEPPALELEDDPESTLELKLGELLLEEELEEDEEDEPEDE